MKQFQALRGFRDLYPEDKIIQTYIFEKLRDVAYLFGYEEYDGPLVEPVDLYLEKSSKELVENQTFQIKTRKDDAHEYVLRPEMTPTLARMIATKENQLTFPIKLFNIGLRFRYEAPQKGRLREFYQADFDILGTDLKLADSEILNTVVSLFLSLKAKKDQFVVYINSRKYLQEELNRNKILEEKQKEVISLIDKKDKLTKEVFDTLLNELQLTENQKKWIQSLKDLELKEVPYFSDLYNELKILGIDQYVKMNPLIVRGLDYYTGLVFEVKSLGEMKRSLLGGGRYDNLVTYFGGRNNVVGVGFATSDVVLLEFIKDFDLIPEISSKKTQILVTVFSPETVEDSLKITAYLRKLNIKSEIYLNPDKKLDKQIKYADKNNIPYVLIAGPEELEKKVVKIKDMKTGEQKEIALENLTLDKIGE